MGMTTTTVTLDCACCHSCCPTMPTGKSLFATFVGEGCTCANGGGSIELTYNAGSGKWEGTGEISICGHDITIKFYYVPPALSVADARVDLLYPDHCRTDDLGRSVGGTSTCDPCAIELSEDMGGPWCGCEVPGAAISILIST